MCTLRELRGVSHLPLLPLGHSEPQLTKAVGHMRGLIILLGVPACDQQFQCTLDLMKQANHASPEHMLILTRNPAILWIYKK